MARLSPPKYYSLDYEYRGITLQLPYVGIAEAYSSPTQLCSSTHLADEYLQDKNEAIISEYNYITYLMVSTISKASSHVS